MSASTLSKVDFLEAGSGPLVVLVHSSASGARQWRRLMEDLKGEFQLRAVNLFGYGETPAWRGRAQSLDDQARLVESLIPAKADKVHIIGHSFGGAVAMNLAARLGQRTGKVVLFEPVAFYLLKQAGRSEAFAEITALSEAVKALAASGQWAAAAEQFADYWGGNGTWRAMPDQRRDAFIAAMKPTLFEWDALMGEATSIEEWGRLLPRSTLLMMDRNTVRPVVEITALLREACPHWTYMEIAAGGHMSPLTHPAVVNPLVAAFLRQPLEANRPTRELVEA